MVKKDRNWGFKIIGEKGQKRAIILIIIIIG